MGGMQGGTPGAGASGIGLMGLVACCASSWPSDRDKSSTGLWYDMCFIAREVASNISPGHMGTEGSALLLL